MRRSEFDRVMESLGATPEEYSEENFEVIHRVYLVCDAFQTHSDICKYVYYFGMVGVERLDRQYSKRQKEVDDLRKQNSALLARIMRVFKDTLLTDNKAMKQIAINFLKEDNLDD